MTKIKKISVVLGAALLLSGCGFHDIETNTSIITTTTAPTDSVLLPPPESSEPDSTSQTTGEPGEPSPYPAKMITTANVNARSGASTADGIIKVVEEGTEITVVGEKDDWYKVDLDGTEAYIIKEYVSEIEAVDESKPDDSSQE